MNCSDCNLLEIISDEIDRKYAICCFSQSSNFLQEVELLSECDIDDDDILGIDYRKED